MTELRLSWIALGATLAVALSLCPAARGQSADQVREHGELVYLVYCVNCHGLSGSGDGPTASVLTVKPKDLTRLRDGRGRFPADEIYRAIDGRERVAGHGDRRMPIWGLSFQDPTSDAPQEPEVRRKIESLVAYLRSIQQD